MRELSPTFEIEIPFAFKYSTDIRPSIDEIIDSLRGIESILKRSPRIINRMFPGIEIDSVSICVDGLRTGSLYEDLIVKFGFGGKDQLNVFIERIRSRLGMDDHKAIPYIVFFLLLGFGSYSAYKFFSSGTANSQVIDSYNNTVINIAAKESGLKPEDIREIIEKALPRSESAKNAKDTIKILKAARTGGTVGIQNYTDIDFGKDLISQVPTDIDENLLDDQFAEYDAIEIEVRAIDMDYHKSGWAAKIPSLSDKRIRMSVEDGVDISKIKPGAPFIGHIIVEYRMKNGKKIIDRIILLGLVVK